MWPDTSLKSQHTSLQVFTWVSIPPLNLTHIQVLLYVKIVPVLPISFASHSRQIIKLDSALYAPHLQFLIILPAINNTVLISPPCLSVKFSTEWGRKDKKKKSHESTCNSGSHVSSPSTKWCKSSSASSLVTGIGWHVKCLDKLQSYETNSRVLRVARVSRKCHTQNIQPLQNYKHMCSSLN